ncbi:MAG: ferrichrome ABC transporter permease [Leifsonia xyli]|jgi:iron complex transport system permease protein|nr:MAG: ferrichrome ABC transporter permease [Leifsonia xyli]
MTPVSRSALLATLAVLVAMGAALVGLMVGARPITFEAAATALLHPNHGVDGVIVWTLRLPRSLAAFVAGAGLATSGFLLQSITRNPLAAPELTGVTAGAVVAIVGAIVFAPSVSTALFAPIGLLGGLAAAAAVFWISGGRRASPLTVALAGVSVSMFLAGVTTYVLLLGGPQSPSVLFWLSGGFQGRSWGQLAFMTPWIAVAIAAAFACHRVVDLLALGDGAAAGMGLNTAFWKSALLLAAVAAVAGVAPIAGPIGFVGLAAPHVVRLTGPPDARWAVALNVALGGMLLTVADLLARSLAAPRELPVGVLTAIVGGPFLVWLVRRRGFGGTAA